MQIFHFSFSREDLRATHHALTDACYVLSAERSPGAPSPGCTALPMQSTPRAQVLCFVHFLAVFIQTPTFARGGELPQCKDCGVRAGYAPDYIVVGGGTSGSIVAARLAQRGQHVVVLEAGGLTQSDPDVSGSEPGGNVFDVPLDWLEVCGNPQYKPFRWEVSGSPLIQILRGLGGCSVGNAMIYMRGIAEDFDLWPKDWDFDTVLPYYKRSENASGFFPSPPPDGNASYHGDAGPMRVEIPGRGGTDKITPQFIAAFKELGYPFIRDLNGAVIDERPATTGRGGRTGAGYLQFAIRNGVRDSAAAAYLGRFRPRGFVRPQYPFTYAPKNSSQAEILKEQTSEGRLVVLLRAQGMRVLFDSSSQGGSGRPRARGVTFARMDPTRPGRPRCRCNLRAKKEIIISAGAINSPKLLLLSGVGDPAALRELGIPVVSENPGVGRNFMDGAYAVVKFRAKSDAVDFRHCDRFGPHSASLPWNSDELFRLDPICRREWRRYVETKSGAFGSPGFFAGGFMQSPGNARPNIQFTLHPYDTNRGIGGSYMKSSYTKSPKTGQNETASGGAGETVITVEVMHNLPKSRGSVTLRSPDPFAPPVLLGNYLSVPSDVDALVWAVLQLRTLFNTGSLRSVIEEEILPGVSVSSRADFEHYFKCGALPGQTGRSRCPYPSAPVVSHFAGTCKMGDLDNDPTAVVDSRLRVRGVDRLRVVDASVMPSLPSGNTAASCLMIGERAADLIYSASMRTGSVSKQSASVSPASIPELTPPPKVSWAWAAAAAMWSLAVSLLLLGVWRYVEGRAWRCKPKTFKTQPSAGLASMCTNEYGALR